MEAVHVKVEVAVPPATRVTDATALQTRPVAGFAESETAPAKPFTETTVTVEDPELVARIVDGETGPRETVKVGAPFTATETDVVLASVLGAVPVVPVTVRVNGFGVGIAVQLTDKVVPDTLAVQPVGAVLVENVTAPENPLIAVNDNAEPLAVPTTTVSEDGLAETEKSWIVTETLVVLDRVLGAVPVVPVTGTVNGATPVEHVTERTLPENEAVQPEGTAPATNVTDPENPLIGVTPTVELPAKVANVVIPGPAIEKSTAWNVTEFDGMVCIGEPPLPVTVTG
jgi:hypothetical protein